MLLQESLSLSFQPGPTQTEKMTRGFENVRSRGTVLSSENKGTEQLFGIPHSICFRICKKMISHDVARGAHWPNG